MYAAGLAMGRTGMERSEVPDAVLGKATADIGIMSSILHMVSGKERVE